MEYESLTDSGLTPDTGGAFDREVFERVWRRVMPEDRPDCPFLLEHSPVAPTPARTETTPAPLESLPAVQEALSPSPARQAVSPGDTRAPAENDVPCLGASSAVHGEQLQTYIEHEISDWRVYQALSRRAPVSAGRILSAIAAEERRHAKRLSAAYFLISGIHYWPADRISAPPVVSLSGTLRQRFADEQRGAASYLAAAEETADACLRALFLELAEDEASHARLIRSVLEQM